MKEALVRIETLKVIVDAMDGEAYKTLLKLNGIPQKLLTELMKVSRRASLC